jgi:hypothetical protein
LSYFECKYFHSLFSIIIDELLNGNININLTDKLGWSPVNNLVSRFKVSDYRLIDGQQDDLFEAGGGSGAGFQLLCGSDIILTAGGGGGGGMSSSSRGGGGGGGVQFLIPSRECSGCKAIFLGGGEFVHLGGGGGCGSDIEFVTRCGHALDLENSITNVNEMLLLFREAITNCPRISIIGGGGGGGGTAGCVSPFQISFGFSFHNIINEYSGISKTFERSIIQVGDNLSQSDEYFMAFSKNDLFLKPSLSCSSSLCEFINKYMAFSFKPEIFETIPLLSDGSNESVFELICGNVTGNLGTVLNGQSDRFYRDMLLFSLLILMFVLLNAITFLCNDQIEEDTQRFYFLSYSSNYEYK